MPKATETPTPLTDAEIEFKFEVKPGSNAFEVARDLSLRPDETLNDLPEYTCPHCAHVGHYDDYGDIEDGDTIECGKCDRVIHVLSVDYSINVTLSTHKPE